MIDPFKEAVGLCKTIMRNGYDAYVINARLQKDVLKTQKLSGGGLCMDISTELDFEGLRRLFPKIVAGAATQMGEGVTGCIELEGVHFCFHPAITEDGIVTGRVGAGPPPAP